jgi:hypothetical protein
MIDTVSEFVGFQEMKDFCPARYGYWSEFGRRKGLFAAAVDVLAGIQVVVCATARWLATRPRNTKRDHIVGDCL